MAERKKSINSKQKGSEYERKIAKILGEWWGEEFQRTPMSGGLQWKQDNRVVGDIVTPPDSQYPFVVECKKRENWIMDQLLKGTGEIEDWWKQVTRDSNKTKMMPMLIFSKNFAPDYIMIKSEDFNKLCRDDILSKADPNLLVVRAPGKPDRVVMELKTFTKMLSKEEVLKSLGI